MNLPPGGPIPSRKMTSRDKAVSFSSRTVHEAIARMKSCGERHLIFRASQTCSRLRTGSTPEGLIGKVCERTMSTIVIVFPLIIQDYGNSVGQELGPSLKKI